MKELQCTPQSPALGNKDLTQTCLLLCLSHQLTYPHTFDFPLVAVACRVGCPTRTLLAAEVPAGSIGKAEQRVSHDLEKSLCESQLCSACSLQGQEGRFLMTSTLAP